MRFKSDDKKFLYKSIKQTLSSVGVTHGKLTKYKEEKWKFKDLESIILFAELLSSVSKLAIGKYLGTVTYDNYRMYERMCHCIHIILYGKDNEIAVLIKRLSERLRNHDIENSIIEILKNK